MSGGGCICVYIHTSAGEPTPRVVEVQSSLRFPQKVSSHLKLQPPPLCWPLDGQVLTHHVAPCPLHTPQRPSLLPGQTSVSLVRGFTPQGNQLSDVWVGGQSIIFSVPLVPGDWRGEEYQHKTLPVQTVWLNSWCPLKKRKKNKETEKPFPAILTLQESLWDKMTSEIETPVWD